MRSRELNALRLYLEEVERRLEQVRNDAQNTADELFSISRSLEHLLDFTLSQAPAKAQETADE
jgi:hypothetical protein